MTAMDAFRDEWAKRSRWPVAHFIRATGRVAWDDDVVARTACGRHVIVNHLEPEPTGIDTVDRCERCLRKTGADV